MKTIFAPSRFSLEIVYTPCETFGCFFSFFFAMNCFWCLSFSKVLCNDTITQKTMAFSSNPGSIYCCWAEECCFLYWNGQLSFFSFLKARASDGRGRCLDTAYTSRFKAIKSESPSKRRTSHGGGGNRALVLRQAICKDFFQTKNIYLLCSSWLLLSYGSGGD